MRIHIRAAALTSAIIVGCVACGGGSTASDISAITGSSSTASPAEDSSPATSGGGSSGESGLPTTTEPAGRTSVAVAVDPEWTSVELGLEQIAELSQPVAMSPRSGTGDLYVAEKGGLVVRLERSEAEDDGEMDTFSLSNRTVLDISGEVSSASEQGLLGLAFSSDGRQLYVSYTDRSGTSVVDRYAMGETEADATTRTEIIRQSQPYANHNGGGITFGPDGFLYYGLGDGGSGGDPQGNGQNTDTLLGALLRIDPGAGDGTVEYSIPAGNPFVDGGGSPEIWLYGVRNPWRFSFDRDTGDLWIADVGQNAFEEVDLLTAADGGGMGANLGWAEMEAFEPFDGGSAPTDAMPPLLAYAHENGRCSVTGGYVYRGGRIPVLDGVYVFGDFCSGEVFGAVDSAGGVVFRTLDLRLGSSSIASFGQDDDGELYVLAIDGRVLALTAATGR